jgi:hypothetical protein
MIGIVSYFPLNAMLSLKAASRQYALLTIPVKQVRPGRLAEVKE